MSAAIAGSTLPANEFLICQRCTYLSGIDPCQLGRVRLVLLADTFKQL